MGSITRPSSIASLPEPGAGSVEYPTGSLWEILWLNKGKTRFMLNPSIPNLAASAVMTELDPLIITAPTTRTGTTLLQRLLCSSHAVLIYGELVAQDLEFFLNLYTFKAQAYTYKSRALARGLEQVLAGDVDHWIPDLMPDVDEYVAAFGQAAFSGIRYCRDYARQRGRPVWGFKCPAWKPALVRLVRTLLPRARWIVITRDLAACVRSAKAQLQLGSLPEVQEFCRTWLEGMDYWRGVGDDPAVLVLSYEELTAAPERPLRRLAEFTGVDDIQADVLKHKLNTWSGDHVLIQAPNGYVPPAQLTEAEQRIVDETIAATERRVT